MWRGVLTLLLGAGVAQLGPLLLGPFLSRLYGPEVFGLFHLASAIGGNLAVVACARYEFALPLARSEAEASALRELCMRVLVTLTMVTLGAASAAVWWFEVAWPLAVPALVATLGALSLWTLEATRRERFGVLARARVVQFWGCGLLQLMLGWVQAGLWSLLLGPVVAAAAAALGLQRSCKAAAKETVLEDRPRSVDWKSVAREHRDFPLFNTPHAFLGALQDTLSMALIAFWAGPAAAGVWGLALRYLKAPATLAGGAVSQVLYPALGATAVPGASDALGFATPAARDQVRRTMRVLFALGLALGLAVFALSHWALPALLGEGWEAAGPLGQALSLYVALHFVASPLGVVTLAWRAQAWALRASIVGQVLFVAALAAGLWAPIEHLGPMNTAAWAVSLAMALYFGWYFWRLWHWPVQSAVDGQPARE
jgi:O-antigen/teichoic acid export membrane protein